MYIYIYSVESLCSWVHYMYACHIRCLFLLLLLYTVCVGRGVCGGGGGWKVCDVIHSYVMLGKVNETDRCYV